MMGWQSRSEGAASSPHALKSLTLLGAVIPWGFTPPQFDFNLPFFFSLMLLLEACYEDAF